MPNQTANASRTPRSLRRAVRIVALVVIAGLLVVGVCLPAIRTDYWIGRRTRTLAFSVVDSESGVPVGHVEVAVFPGPFELGIGVPHPAPDPSDSRARFFSTDEHGKVDAACEFDAYGHTNWFTDWGRVRFWNRYIRVAATGYDSERFRLGERIGEQRDFHDDSRIELVVELKRPPDTP